MVKFIDSSKLKPALRNGFKTLSDRVEVKTEFGYGTGVYNHIDKDWLIDVNDTDEIQAYTGKVYWKYMN